MKMNGYKGDIMGCFLNYRSIVFFDLETVRRTPVVGVDTIIAISVIKDFRNGESIQKDLKIKMTEEKLKHAEQAALKINGYNEKDWEDAITLEEAARIIIPMMNDSPIIAHNIVFDYNHLTTSLDAIGWTKLDGWSRDVEKEIDNKEYSFGMPLIDTYSLSWLFNDSQKHNLNHLRESMLNVSTDRAHSADTDTEDCRALFYQLMGKKLLGVN